jgi:hypothetical protein
MAAKSVRIIEPPAPHKDLRAWCIAGTTREDVDRAIAAAKDALLMGPIAEAWKPLPTGMLSTVPPSRPYVLRWTKRDGVEGPPRQGPGFVSGGIVGVLSGAGGTLKSTTILMLAVSIVTGRRWLGFDVGSEFVGRRCALLFAEEDLEEVHRRLYRIANHLDLNDEERRLIEEKLIVAPLKGKPCALTVPGEHGALPSTTANLTTLKRLVQDGGEPWGMIGLDPQSRLSPGAEGSNDASTSVVQLLEDLGANAPGAPLVLLAGHSSKTARREGKADARGVTGLTDAARVHLTLVRRENRLELESPKVNYGVATDRPIVMRIDDSGVPILDGASQDAAPPDAAAQQEADVEAVVAAVRAKGPIAPVDAIGPIAKVPRSRARIAVRLAVTRGWIIARGSTRDREYVVP